MSHTPLFYKLFTRALPVFAFFTACEFGVASPIPSPSPAANLESFVDTFAREHDFSGTILVHESATRKYARSFGSADRAFNVPADSNTRYRIASITKLFTSALILQLRDEGKLDLNGSIRKYLPDYAGEGADDITIHHLLNHTSGLPQY